MQFIGFFFTFYFVSCLEIMPWFRTRALKFGFPYCNFVYLEIRFLAQSCSGLASSAVTGETQAPPDGESLGLSERPSLRQNSLRMPISLQ